MPPSRGPLSAEHRAKIGAARREFYSDPANREAQSERILAIRPSHGWVGTPTYRSWSCMKTRCTNPKRKEWPRYGGRGITFCARWVSFENFLADMGERPEGMTLDRIDNDGNYEPGNCRWATAPEQAHNSRVTKLTAEQIEWIKAHPELSLNAAARAIGIGKKTILDIRHGRRWV